MINHEPKLIQTSGQLFEDVQLSGIFEDSKYFVDMIPNKDPSEILELYSQSKNDENFDLLKFVNNHFDDPIAEKKFDDEDVLSLSQYIYKMWGFLLQEAECVDQYSSLIQLPKPYIIPGGRFREVYYWDCYFTCEGLRADGKISTIQDIADNFSSLITKFGFIPNANRSYYLTRSQPPLFFLIVKIIYKELGINSISKYLESLKKEHDFWMNTDRNIDGLNRYWDDSPTPRPESYKEDIEHANGIVNKKDFYRNIRAACESGWDFSSRWLSDNNDLSTIHTTDIFPIDLNSYLYGLEHYLSLWSEESGDTISSSHYKEFAANRKRKIQKEFWCDTSNFYCDINHKSNKISSIMSLAASATLFLNIATDDQAKHIAKRIESEFLTDLGLLTTTTTTHQQWDSPNGWAPLQWQTVIGLKNYGYHELAETIAKNFVNTVNTKYQQIGKIREKYDVCNLDSKATGGEYVVQDGFGWTNGVTIAFIDMYNL
jgi:alpha,alpha-trehalase